MTLKTTSIRPATTQEWDDAWSATPTATFSMSREWAQLWASISNGTLAPSPSLVSFNDGRQAVLPLVEFRQYKGLLRDYEMCAAGAYGSPLSATPLGIEHHRLLLGHLLSLRNVAWMTSPIDESAADYAIADAESQDTHILPLAGQMTDVLKRWSKGARAAVKQAQRAGVVVRLADSPAHWRSYFDVYQDSRRRWGKRATSNHPWAVFARLSGMNPARIRLWLAELDGKVVAGALCLYGQTHVAYWHGAARESAFEARPVNLLMSVAIEHALTSGHRWFDFGLSGGHEGVAAFKHGFGADPVACHSVKLRATTTRLAKRVLSMVVGG